MVLSLERYADQRRFLVHVLESESGIVFVTISKQVGGQFVSRKTVHPHELSAAVLGPETGHISWSLNRPPYLNKYWEPFSGHEIVARFWRQNWCRNVPRLDSFFDEVHALSSDKKVAQNGAQIWFKKSVCCRALQRCFGDRSASFFVPQEGEY